MIEAIVGLTALGGGLGLFLGVAAKKLHVEADPLDAEIESILPGTNCGQCGFPGCSAAAKAIISGEAPVTTCPPGGKLVAKALAEKLHISLDLSSVKDNGPTVAIVNEDACIGCGRCSRKCPTDAIVGAAKMVHSVVQDACTGCSACVEVCPAECIELEPIPVTLQSWYWPKPSDDQIHPPMGTGVLKQ